MPLSPPSNNYSDHFWNKKTCFSFKPKVVNISCLITQVTFKYYVGRKAMFDSDFRNAEKYLTFAFERCHKCSKKNKRLILIYLLPVKMLLGYICLYLKYLLIIILKTYNTYIIWAWEVFRKKLLCQTCMHFTVDLKV